MRPYGLGNWEEISAISRSSDLYNLEIARSQWYLHSQNELSHLEIQSGTFRTLNFALVCIRKFKVEVPVDMSQYVRLVRCFTSFLAADMLYWLCAYASLKSRSLSICVNMCD